MKKQPKRIQRKRTKGWRMPKGAVYVGRPSKWGNPYKVDGGWIDGHGYLSCSTDRAGRRAKAVSLFEKSLQNGHWGISAVDVKRELRGKDLVCWCKPGDSCHADVLLKVANSTE